MSAITKIPAFGQSQITLFGDAATCVCVCAYVCSDLQQNMIHMRAFEKYIMLRLDHRAPAEV